MSKKLTVSGCLFRSAFFLPKGLGVMTIGYLNYKDPSLVWGSLYLLLIGVLYVFEGIESLFYAHMVRKDPAYAPALGTQEMIVRCLEYAVISLFGLAHIFLVAWPTSLAPASVVNVCTVWTIVANFFLIAIQVSEIETHTSADKTKKED